RGHKPGGVGDFTRITQIPDVRTGLIVVVIAVVSVLMLWLIRRWWPGQWSVADPPGFGFVRPVDPRFFLYALLIGIAAAFLGALLTEALAHGHPVHQDVTVMGHDVTPGVRVALAVLVVG